MFRKLPRKRIEARPDHIGLASLDDFERLYTLCTVWPSGPMARAYIMTPNPGLASKAAAEVRKAITESFYSQYEIGQDQIELLWRVEAGTLQAEQHVEEILEQD